MNLADHIIAARESLEDVFGSITSAAATLEKAQRFDLADDVVKACGQLTDSKPSSLVAALPLCRLPYDNMWIEYRGGLGPEPEGQPGRPIPARQGFLIECVDHDAKGQVGIATLAWVHTHERPAVTIAPFAIYFDWRTDGDVIEVIRSRHKAIIDGWKEEKTLPIVHGIVKTFDMRFLSNALDPLRIKQFFVTRKNWEKHTIDDKQIEAFKMLERHMLFGISPHGMNTLVAVAMHAMVNQAEAKSLYDNWLADIQGEGTYLQCLLAMMNSRNCVENIPIDLSRLNKARARRGKRPLLSHARTNLVLSRSMTRVAEASGMTRDAARQHLVCGHFKIRRTGVFWWTPFLRGDPKRGKIARESYDVTLT